MWMWILIRNMNAAIEIISGGISVKTYSIACNWNCHSVPNLILCPYHDELALAKEERWHLVNILSLWVKLGVEIWKTRTVSRYYSVIVSISRNHQNVFFKFYYFQCNAFNVWHCSYEILLQYNYLQVRCDAAALRSPKQLFRRPRAAHCRFCKAFICGILWLQWVNEYYWTVFSLKLQNHKSTKREPTIAITGNTLWWKLRCWLNDLLK